MSEAGSIELINASVTIVKPVSRGLAPKPSQLGSASGFFFLNNDRKFLVTNRHVVINEKDSLFPDALTIQVHTDRTHAPPCRELTLPLYDGGRRLWLEHPGSNEENRIDLIAIEIEDILAESDFIRFWTPDDIIPDKERPPLGASVSVIGYPLGFYDEINNLPVTRSGSIASPFWTHFRMEPLFLVDANLHAGTSGSPVILPTTKIPDISDVEKGAESWPYYLLGINSGEYPGLGLNAIWYAYLLLDIVPT